MDTNELKEILRLHKLWLEGDTKEGVKADLKGANLRGADLSGANLRGADLSGANLRGADLSGTNLYGADLSRANLYGADLSGANLYGADLRGTNLYEANLSGANLDGANLDGANLCGANLYKTKLPPFQITPKGYPMVGFKKLRDGVICTLEIPPEAERTASLVGRKCRAEYAKVLEGNGQSGRDNGETVYKVGKVVYPDKYDGDIRVECTSGIHFFQTKEEAESY